MQKQIKPFFLLLLTVFLLAALSFSIPFSASAAAVDSTSGSISMTLYEASDSRTPIPGAAFMLWRVADAVQQNGALHYTVADSFAGSGIDLAELATDGAATHLLSYALTNSIPATTAIAGKMNTAIFSNLSAGIYLLAQSGTVEGYYPFVPFLVTLPVQAEDGSLVYDVNASPKAEAIPENLNPGRLMVKKEWVTNGHDIPDSISIHLLRNYEVFETVELSSENGWSYTWTGLDRQYAWDVAEASVPAGWISPPAYSTAGNTVTIINTHEDFEEPTTEPPGTSPSNPTTPTTQPTTKRDDTTTQPTKPGDDDTLIHTGQLTWPIPVLAIMGLMLFAAGWIITASKGKRTK